jgi:RNase H domain-containing protein
LPTGPGQKVRCAPSVVGLWLLKQYAGTSMTGVVERLPVMVHIEGQSGRVRAMAGRMCTWLPYREVLLMIARGEVRGVKQDGDALRLIETMLRRDLPGDTLLLCHAQNLRLAWSWLGNRQLTLDHLAFGHRETPQPINLWPGLRVARVRDSDRHETPETYAVSADGSISYASGLFRMGERLFASVNGKPPQFKLSRHFSKLGAWTTGAGRRLAPRPSQHAWNARICEIAMVCLQEGDDPAGWAAWAHRLRRGAHHYEEGLALPLPLHLAKLVKEYVLPLTEVEETV